MCASVCMGILSVSAFGTNVQVCACMCEHKIVRFCACYCYVVYYCMYVCISTNSVDEHGECIHPSSTTSPWAYESFFLRTSHFCLFLSDTVLMPVPVPRCVPLSAVAFNLRSS